MDAPSVLRIGLAVSRPELHALVQSLLSRADSPLFDAASLAPDGEAVASILRAEHDAYLIDSAAASGSTANDTSPPPVSELFSAAVATGRPVIVLAAGEDCFPRFLEAGAWDCLPPATLTTVTLARSLALSVHHARRWAAERRQLHVLKDEAIARFAGGLAHDLNNLLTAMLGYAEMLRESLDEHDSRREDVLEIQRAGERAAALTRQLNTFGLRQPVMPRLLDLNAIVLRLSAILGPLLGSAPVDIETRENLDAVRADASQLELLITNLAKNARDAMAPGGRLRIETGMAFVTERQAEERPHARPGKHVTVSVADEGIGMSPDVTSHLFEPFFTTKEKGKRTGLGLAAAYGIVRQAGGHITVRSEPGKGTTVTVYFPAATTN